MDAEFWCWISGYFAAALAAISLWAWKHTHGLIGKKADVDRLRAIESIIDRKADEARLGDLAARFTSALDTHLRDSREDNRAIYEAIQRVSLSHGQFTEHVIAALGERPTRSEIREMQQTRGGGGK